MPGGKQKPTLTVDAATVERAKVLGINISDLTEQVLKGYAFDMNDPDPASLRQSQLALLKTMDPLLSRYSASVPVGDYVAKPGVNDKPLESEI